MPDGKPSKEEALQYFKEAVKINNDIADFLQKS